MSVKKATVPYFHPLRSSLPQLSYSHKSMASHQTPHHRRNQPAAVAAAAAASPKADPKTPSHPPSPKLDSVSHHSKKPTDSEEKLERMINCIAAKETPKAKPQLLARSLSSRTRTSISASQISLAHVFANNGIKLISADMPPFMQVHAVDCASKTHNSMQNFTSKSLALALKKEFDGVYGPAWHCIVGKSFGSFVTHSVGGFMYFSMAQKLYILLFKTTVQRAN